MLTFFFPNTENRTSSIHYTEQVLFTIQNKFYSLYKTSSIHYTEQVLFTIQNKFYLLYKTSSIYYTEQVLFTMFYKSANISHIISIHDVIFHKCRKTCEKSSKKHTLCEFALTLYLAVLSFNDL